MIYDSGDEPSLDELLALSLRVVACDAAGVVRVDAGADFVADALGVLLARERPLAAKVRAAPPDAA